MKILTVVGARPQFIKAAAVSGPLRLKAREVLVHTGQHYDPLMSGVFFEELSIPKPDYELGVGSGPHGAQTASMLKGLEEIMLKESPDWVLVYGDTNSTLAGALAAAKLGLPLAHVEAGLRSFNRGMPEEINRVLTDHLSSLLFCPGPSAVQNLKREGIVKGVETVGDVMKDFLLDRLRQAGSSSKVLGRLGLKRGGYFLATVHRAENTDQPRNLEGILGGLGAIAGHRPVIWPMHPRARRKLDESGLVLPPGVRALEPASYLEMLALEDGAAVILTDSGGVQKEAWWIGVPCVTLREETEWPETLEGGFNQLSGCDPSRVAEAARKALELGRRSAPAKPDGAPGRIVTLLTAKAGTS